MELVQLQMSKLHVLKTLQELIVFGIQHVKKRLVLMHQQLIILMNYVHHTYQHVLLEQEVDVNLELVLMLQQH